MARKSRNLDLVVGPVLSSGWTRISLRWTPRLVGK